MRQMLILGLILLTLVGCGEANRQETATYAPAQSLTPTAQVFLPLVSAPPGECKTHTAAMTLSATTATVRTGDVLTLTVSLANRGCGTLGLPSYQLDVQPPLPQPIFEPPAPQPLTHQVGINAGQSDSAQFVLRATAPGQATLIATASFEVHLAYPGPTYWANAVSKPLTINITP